MNAPHQLAQQEAVQKIEQAQSRLAVLSHLLQGVHWHFTFAEVFVVKNGGISGLIAISNGQLDTEGMIQKKVSLPESSIAYRAIHERTPFMLPSLSNDPCAAVCPPHALMEKNAVLLPIKIQDATVCLLIGHYTQDFPPGGRNSILKLVEVTSKALVRLMQPEPAQPEVFAEEPGAPESFDADPIDVDESPLFGSPVGASLADQQPQLDPPSVQPDGIQAGPPQQTEKSAAPANSVMDLNLDLVDLIAKGKVKVPPFPGIVTKLNQMIAADTYSSKKLADVIKADQSLTAGVLRLANSIYYGGSTKVNSLEQGISRIGVRALVNLTLSSSVGSYATAKGPLQNLKHLIWSQAISSANLCQHLAPFRKLDTNEAFICGLLHDFGKVVAIACIEQVIAKRTDVDSLPADYWMQVVEQHHLEFGRIVGEEWNLPDTIKDVIARHHELGPEVEGEKMLQLVVCADRIVDMLENSPHVSLDGLQEIRGLDNERELQSLAKFLPMLPAITVDPGRASDMMSESLVEKAETTLTGERRRVDFKVVRQSQEEEVEYQARYITGDGIAIAGKTAIQENSLVSLVLWYGAEPLQIWSRTTLCEKEAEGFRVESRPFALSSEALDAWQVICAEAARAG